MRGLSARETVERCTPAAWATSLSVARRFTIRSSAISVSVPLMASRIDSRRPMSSACLQTFARADRGM